METNFEEFGLVHVPRDQNARADLLSKLTSTKKVGQSQVGHLGELGSTKCNHWRDDGTS